ncbi:MAG: ADOP family duplicated permease [Gemmatimonadales bacterium]
MRRLLRRAWRAAAALVGRRRLDAEDDEEFAFHLAMEQRRLEAGGLSPAEARRQAAVGFGASQQFREESRDLRGTGPLIEAVRDVRLGFRALRRQPLPSALLLLTLSLGIGGSAAIVGVVEGVLLSPLPYAEPDRLMTLWERDAATGEPNEVPPGLFLDWRERSRSFASLTAMEPYGLDWTSPEGPVYLPTWLVYEHFFDTFGVRPLLGRTPRPDEHAAGRDAIVVLGYDLWQRRFGGDPAVVGRIEMIDGKPHQIVGVMPRGFAQPSDAVVWAPKVLAGWERQARRRGGYYRVFGRLAPGVTEAVARAEMETISGQLSAEFPGAGIAGLTIEPLADRILGPARRPLWLLLGAVIAVFAIVLANAASLELARAISRTREFAVRGALGASRGRLTRQRLAESLALATVATALGFGVAWLVTAALRATVPAEFPRAETLAADSRVLILSAAGSLLAAIAIGVAPTLLAARESFAGGAGTRVTGNGKTVVRLQGALVVTQVALGLALLVGASLLARSFAAVLTSDRGFEADRVAVVSVQSWDRYPTPAARIEFARQVVDRLALVPGVRAAGISTSIPLMETIGSEHVSFRIDGQPIEGEAPFVQYAAVSPGFFAALAIPLRAGRMFDPAQGPGTAPTAVVNEAFARRYFPGTNPIGARLRLGPAREARDPPPVEIIGVVGDVRRQSLAERAVPWVYFSHAQSGSGANAFLAAGSGSGTALLAAARQAVWSVDPAMPLHLETTMARLVGDSVRDRRFVLFIVGGFAAVALILAAAGLHALMTFLTRAETREIGLRVALGAGRRDVIALILRRGVVLVGLGMLIGTALAAATARALTGLLYGVGPADPATIVLAPTALGLAALLACWLPARKAARADPMEALRTD